MKSFKQIVEENTLNEGGEMYPADDMTMKELKIACYAAQNILDRLEDGAMIQRWQISAIVKAKEELASVYTSMSADEDDDKEWEDEEDPMYVGYEYPSMYEEVDVNKSELKAVIDAGKKKGKIASVEAVKYIRAKHSITHTSAHNIWKNIRHELGEEAELDEETKYVVKGKSPFYKQDHYVNTHETPKAQLAKKHIKHATHMDLETAKKVAKSWESHPNKYKTEVVPVNEETEIDESYQELSTLKTRIARNTKKMKSLPDLHPEKKKLTIAVAKDTKKHDDLFKRQFKNEEVQFDEGYNDPEYIRRAIPALKNAVEFHKDMMKDHDKKSVKGSPEYVKAHSAAAHAHKEAAERHRIAHAQLSVGSKDVEYYVKPARELGAHAEKLSDKANRLKEEVDYAVDIEGLPKMYVKGDSPAQVKANLRKIIKKPDMIQSVDRVTQSMLKKIFRDKATGKDEVAEEVKLDEVSKNTLKSYISKKSQQIIDKDDKSDPYGINSGGSSKERNRDFDKLNIARRKLKD